METTLPPGGSNKVIYIYSMIGDERWGGGGGRLFWIRENGVHSSRRCEPSTKSSRVRICSHWINIVPSSRWLCVFPRTCSPDAVIQLAYCVFLVQGQSELPSHYETSQSLFALLFFNTLPATAEPEGKQENTKKKKMITDSHRRVPEEKKLSRIKLDELSVKARKHEAQRNSQGMKIK